MHPRLDFLLRFASLFPYCAAGASSLPAQDESDAKRAP